MPTTKWFFKSFEQASQPARKRTAGLFSFIALASILACCQAFGQVTVGYYPNWVGIPATSSTAATLSTNPTTLKTLYQSGALSNLTYLNYAFGDVDASGNCAIGPGDVNNALERQYTAESSIDGIADSSDPTELHGDLNQLLKLKNLLRLQGKTIKILISVGGSTYGAGSSTRQGTFSQAAAKGATFADNCISTFIAGNFTNKVDGSSPPALSHAYPGIFDGIDIDWEYPEYSSANPPFTDNFAGLLSTFRSELNKTSSSLILTAAVTHMYSISGTEGDFSAGSYSMYNFPASASSVNFFNYMAYDYLTGALMSNASLPDIQYDLSLLLQTQAGETKPFLTPSQIVMGVPFYGFNWTKTPTPTSYNPLTVATGQNETVLTVDSNGNPVSSPYWSLVNTLSNDGVTSSSFQFDQSTVTAGNLSATWGAWAYDSKANGGTLWNFDDTSTIASKASYVLNTGNSNGIGALGGMIAWDLSQDASGGTLLCAIQKGLNSASTCSAPPAAVEITLESNIAGASFTISGTDCPSGTFYTNASNTPVSVLWSKSYGCSVTATAPSGYTFSGWADGNATNPRSFAAQTANATYTADFTVVSACTFSLSSTVYNPTAAAAASSVNVTATSGCAWTASSSATWITITAGASGTGSGTVDFRVTANTGAARTGTLTIAGKTFTVNQAAAATTAATALQFVPMTPCRVVDTRNANGAFGGPELAANTARTFAFPSSSCGIPTNASAYAINVTIPTATSASLTVWPTGQAQPADPTVNAGGRIRANAAIVAAGSSGSVNVIATAATHVVLDINGYFVPKSTNNPNALAFHSMAACRLVDTRGASSSSFSGTTLLANTVRNYSLVYNTNGCNIPASAQAYSLNFTVVPVASQGASGYLTAWSMTSGQPAVSTLNYTGNISSESNSVIPVANAAIVRAGDIEGDPISVYVSESTDLIIDINGYFALPAATDANALSTPLSMYNVTNCRVLDKSGVNGSTTVPVEASSCAVPSAAQGYVFNATVAPQGSLEYLTLWPAGQTQPTVSTLNAVDGTTTSNMAIVPTTNGSIDAFTSSSTTLILDISSYFAP